MVDSGVLCPMNGGARASGLDSRLGGKSAETLKIRPISTIYPLDRGGKIATN
jgi:hypothetical protein